jgi:hypothetical protein
MNGKKNYVVWEQLNYLLVSLSCHFHFVLGLIRPQIKTRDNRDQRGDYTASSWNLATSNFIVVK